MATVGYEAVRRSGRAEARLYAPRGKHAWRAILYVTRGTRKILLARYWFKPHAPMPDPRNAAEAAKLAAWFDRVAQVAFKVAVTEGKLDASELDVAPGRAVAKRNPPKAKPSKPKAFRAGLAEGTRKRESAAAKAYLEGLRQGLREAGIKRNPPCAGRRKKVPRRTGATRSAPSGRIARASSRRKAS